MLEKVAWMNMLFDFYGVLLTERQKDFMDLYYCQNLSLGEIAGEFNVTRQAVYDTLKRAEQVLSQYEEKLGLVTKSTAERNKLATAAAMLEEYETVKSDGRVQQARKIIEEVLEM
ncbi:YlxM family DNA-binding protein [Pelotomaculum propionicicum]|uniref:YlxM family DNA-binding protein n=1 Tax=Pelotomaculum propionicicum TaxID=258475 RepID=UPI003B7FB673